MTFNDDQKASLGAPLNRAQVKARKQGGRTFSYIEGWHVIAEANRIFGFDGWQRETIETKCVTEAAREIGENKAPGFGVTYNAKVRVTVGDIVREGCGTGHGIDRDLGLAHESALKEAETDAMKRAFMTFGNPFGLALYDKEQANVMDESEMRLAAEVAAKRQSFLEHYKASIEGYTDAEKLKAFWSSDGQKAARRAYQLLPDDVEMLKGLVVAKVAKLGGGNAAS
ncbi:Rad52/Rad22 family DNA repair protein [Bradyrhizobium sp. 1(2017)]|uniref:Rad52/Rad22 family DNA repair protein n=1 Tax=Bradyrhizobium sp. 1(2017) TaxID=1404888 RepID=UPI00140E9EBE|nr:RAD52 family DNA repair protein [Bradyrhizobium sp. 1(2017)]QIO34351.1 hypothetical protein HAP40_22405 [Bradyrhizobium sp. 1(2017)]